jgi:cleavage and polyadenylation specificity factor subunit 2
MQLPALQSRPLLHWHAERHHQHSCSRADTLLTHAPQTSGPSADAHKRSAALVDTVLSTLRADGNVLLPVDSAGRVLELVLLLDKYWTQHK